jgi:hypothetical protein
VRIELSLQARLELFAAQDRYEAERDGLGQRFIDEMDRVAARIAAAPQQVPVIPGSAARRALGRRFPYALVFFVYTHHVRIIAVAHQHRDSGHWAIVISSLREHVCAALAVEILVGGLSG